MNIKPFALKVWYKSHDLGFCSIVQQDTQEGAGEQKSHLKKKKKLDRESIQMILRRIFWWECRRSDLKVEIRNFLSPIVSFGEDSYQRRKKK